MVTTLGRCDYTDRRENVLPFGTNLGRLHRCDGGGYYATTGLYIERDGTNHDEDINLATKNALLNVIDHPVHKRGFTRMQAYVIASVGVDVTVYGFAGVPNSIVSAILPDDIFVRPLPPATGCPTAAITPCDSAWNLDPFDICEINQLAR